MCDRDRIGVLQDYKILIWRGRNIREAPSFCECTEEEPCEDTARRKLRLGVVAVAFNPSTREAEGGGSLSWRPVRSAW